MTLTVIIPTHRRPDHLHHCLQRLAPGAQTLPPHQYHVIVTDDSPPDDTRTRHLVHTHHLWATHTTGPRRGPAANRNHGATHATTPWLVFTDDDTLPQPHWLQAYLESIHARPDSLLLEGRTSADRPRQRLSETAPINETGGHLWSCNFAIQRHLFQHIGGFDPRYPHACMEDTDLRLRLLQHGHTPLFIPGAQVIHPWRPSPGWPAHCKYRQSILIHLAIHPQERQRINTLHYLRTLLHILRHELPALLLRPSWPDLRHTILRLANVLLMPLVLTLSPSPPSKSQNLDTRHLALPRPRNTLRPP